MEINNPASRFLSIIKKGQNEGRNTATLQVFAKLFGVEPNDKSLLLKRIGDLMSIPRLIRNDVSQLEEVNENLLLKWLTPAEESLETINLRAKWQSFIDHYKPDVIYGMEVCADALSRTRPEKTLKNDERQSLLSAINSTIESLESEEIPANIKEFFFNRLNRVRDALEAYIILGIEPIELELESLKGSVSRDPEFYMQTRTSNGGEAFWTTMAKVALIINIFTGSLQIGYEINEILADTDPKIKFDSVFEPSSEINIAQIPYKDEP